VNNLMTEMNYYIEHKEELLKKYCGKFIVIKKNNVIDVCNNYEEALNRAETKYKFGTFMIRQVQIDEPIIETHICEFFENETGY